MSCLMIEVVKPSEVGKDFAKLPGIDGLIVAGRLVLGFPGQLAYISTLMINMVKVPAEYLWMPVG